MLCTIQRNMVLWRGLHDLASWNVVQHLTLHTGADLAGEGAPWAVRWLGCRWDWVMLALVRMLIRVLFVRHPCSGDVQQGGSFRYYKRSSKQTQKEKKKKTLPTGNSLNRTPLVRTTVPLCNAPFVIACDDT